MTPMLLRHSVRRRTDALVSSSLYRPGEALAPCLSTLVLQRHGGDQAVLGLLRLRRRVADDALSDTLGYIDC